MARPDEEFPLLTGVSGPGERDIETPTADAVEQAALADPARTPKRPLRRLSFEADEYDVIEQAVVVDLGDDDYH